MNQKRRIRVVFNSFLSIGGMLWIFGVFAIWRKADAFGEDSCFCELSGNIDDCSCQIDTVDKFNNFKIYPRLQSLLTKDYFRYYEVNLKKECPFWSDDGKCSLESCSVRACSEEEVPPGIKGGKNKWLQNYASHNAYDTQFPMSSKIKDCDEDLGYINTTISAESLADFEKWKVHDESLSEFCSVWEDEVDPNVQYVDLLLNPERYTGYRGHSSHRIWNAIYKENCFQDADLANNHPLGTAVDTCIEKRTFFRAISGLHSSISIHLSAKYLLQGSMTPFKSKTDSQVWGPNVTEFRNHFEKPESQLGQFSWLKNLYFLYLVELKAITKAAPFLSSFPFYTGNDEEDADMRKAIGDLLEVAKSFPSHFEESTMFSSADAPKLRSEFHERFTNITKIMDCVGCQKCKLWGKLQIKGLGTALKILFSNNPKKGSVDFLSRNEIVALVNAFGRLSESVFELQHFRNLINSNDKETKNSKPLVPF